MKTDSLLKKTVLCSIAFHCCVIGVPFGRLVIAPPPEPEIMVETEVEHPPLLPPIRKIEEERQIKQVEETPVALPPRDELPPEPQKAREEPVTPTPLEEEAPVQQEPLAAPLKPEPIPESLAEKPSKKVDPGARTGETERESVFRYRDAVKQRLEAARRYPRIARQRGIEGTAVVFFTIQPDGSIRNLAIVRSSGSGLLDDEVIATVRRATPFPLPPDGLAIDIQVPVIFSIQ